MFVKNFKRYYTQKEERVQYLKNDKKFSWFIQKQNIIVKYDENYRVRLKVNEIGVLKKRRKILYNEI